MDRRDITSPPSTEVPAGRLLDLGVLGTGVGSPSVPERPTDTESAGETVSSCLTLLSMLEWVKMRGDLTVCGKREARRGVQGEGNLADSLYFALYVLDSFGHVTNPLERM